MLSNFEINSNSKKPLPNYLIDGNNLRTFSAILSNFWISFIIHLKQSDAVPSELFHWKIENLNKVVPMSTLSLCKKVLRLHAICLVYIAALRKSLTLSQTDVLDI